MPADDFDWIVEQQRHALEGLRLSAYEELSCENGNLRQQLICAGIREDRLSEIFDGYRDAKTDLKQPLDYTSAEEPWNNICGGNDWVMEQQRLFDHYAKNKQMTQEPKQRMLEDSWQHPLDEWVEITKEEIFGCSRPVTRSPLTEAAQDDPPPPYEERPALEDISPHSPGQYLYEAQGSLSSSRSPRVRFAQSPDIIPVKAPRCFSRRKKEPKKQVVALYRKRSNRTAVGLLVLPLA
ncbi:hypothetical protein BJ166DRAFT_24669 [Pestalotiopsis sp. NC0098]|nr:hypothetical protein BJ166DRAFT_24669 [Pestalotiopsis sp. NC0098]